MKHQTSVVVFALAVVGTCLFTFAEQTLDVAPGGLTPQQALEKIRTAKAAGDKGAWTVRVKAGTYPLRETLTFRPEDSGTPEAPVRWIGEPGKTIIAGGEPIVGWTDDGDGAWSAPLPKAPDGKSAFFEQLWVNGRRAERARLPNTGWLKTQDMTCNEEKGITPKNFIEKLVVTDPAAAALAKIPADELAWAQMCLIDKWTFARRILRGVAAVSNGVAVTTHAPAAWPNFASWSKYNTIVAFENVRAAFDAPGEWFYDAKDGRVRYRPRPGEDMAKAFVLAPSAGLSQLVAFAGDPEKGKLVHDVSFEGISFEASASKTIVTDVIRKATEDKYVPPSEGPTESWQYQAAQSSDAAITCEGVQRVAWTNCCVRHTANYGFRFNDGCQYVDIVDCTLEDLGAGGVWMGARKSYPPPGTGDKMQRREYLTTGPKSVAHNLISNCTIRAAGKFNPEGTGVAITHASFCRVIHCDIYDIMYTGVSVGWVWGWAGSVAQHNEIAYNRIYDLGKDEMSDMGGVYTLGTSFGTRVHHNVIHDVWSYTYGGWGLYTDEGSEDVVMEYNLVWNTEDGGFHQHFGSGNTIRNNIFAWNKSIGAFRASRDKVKDVPCSVNFVGNIVLVDGSPFMGGGCAAVKGVWANNVWWDIRGKATFGGTPWSQWCKEEREWNSLNADPLFVDAKKYDFRLKPESPAFTRGFKAWDYAEAGVKAGGVSRWPVLKTYEGECLRRIKMPLGGIGTGTVSLNGRGGLVDWAVRNAPAIGFTPQVEDVSTGFWLRTEEADGRVSARLMEGPVDTSLYEGGEGGRFPNHGFPRFRSNVFKVAYPLAQVALADSKLPVDATLEAMNPLVPGDAEASGIPAALLRWKLSNKTAKPVKASVLGFLVNAAGGTVTNAVVAGGGLRGVSLGSGDDSASDSTLGRIALVAPESAGDVSVARKIADLGWRIRLDRYWKQFVATGRAAEQQDPDSKTDYPAVAVSVTVELAANETKDVPFVLAWRFPNRAGWSGRGYRDHAVKGSFDPKRAVGNYYATRFATPESAAAALWKDLPSLEAKTVAFVKGVLASKAPDVVQEAALFNLSTLRTETCFRTADGHFFGWEGIFDDHGSCYGSCSHVWGYEHALVDLWPDLAKDMTELQFGPAMDACGHIANRINLPLDPKNAANDLAAADGQMQCLVKAYENWKKTGDDAWMKRHWPKFRKAMEFCWIAGGWDADRDGVMEGCQHNTMDVEYYGPNPQMEFLYLAALKAVAAMGDAAGDAEFAKECRALAAKGSAWTEKNLFNGQWYEHKVMPPKGTIAKGLSYGNASDLSDPDFQLAAGCLVDQLLGDYAARHVGLGAVADERNAAKTLDTILAKCASDNVGPRYNCGRDYAFPEERALKMAWYPEGRMPQKPFPYYGENMTGFEYVVAANLAQRGRFAEAEKVVRDIRARYDGRKRNPFDEAECGHHYARALVAWSVLKAWR